MAQGVEWAFEIPIRSKSGALVVEKNRPTQFVVTSDCSKKLDVAVVYLVAALLLWTLPPSVSATETPIVAYTAHREFSDVLGLSMTLTKPMIVDTQSRFISLLEKRLQESGNTAEMSDVQTKKNLIESLVSDEVLANALLIDVLADSSVVEVESRIVSIHHAMRWRYVLEIEIPTFTVEPGTFSKGIAPDIASILESGGIEVIYFTKAAGPAYSAECAATGVPIPPPMFADPWVNNQSFNDSEFEAVEFDPELWVYESENPEGICLALPRYNGANKAALFGIICLGLGEEESNACFWDNDRTVPLFSRGVPIGIDQFVGGVDLVANAQGVCSNCHAGENPFVIHPEVGAFAGVSEKSQPSQWHNPLVDPSWPQNPGPTSLLDNVASPGDCTLCHRAGRDGRLPEVSTTLNQYCDAILGVAVHTDGKRPGDPGVASWADVVGTYVTMPAYQRDFGDNFKAHIGALEDACGEGPATGVVTITGPIPDDVNFISHPIVIDPLYGCASGVAVRGALLDATVFVYVNGVLQASGVSRNPDLFTLSLPAPLVVGDEVTATQKLGGALSASSDPVVVRDHTVDFPAGLPAPTIDPTLIHECGNVIAARHLPGADLTVWVNGAFETNYSTTTGWSGLYPGKRPFVVGDAFKARISLCDDVSPVSDAAVAVSAPSPMSTPQFNPPTIYEGQELVGLRNLVHSSLVTVSEGVVGPLVASDVAISYWPNIDVGTPLTRPLDVGDSLTAQQKLCEINYSLGTPDVKECDELPAPRIRRPIAGNDYVVLTESVAGARIRVFDSTDTELGDGSGTIIQLNRVIVASEVLRVTQSLNGCDGQLAYFATAQDEDEIKLTPPGGAGTSSVQSTPASKGTNFVGETAILQVILSGATEGSIDVCFHDADTGAVIDCDYSVEDGATAAATWTGLATGTSYRWFARGTDVLLRQAESDTVEFTTASLPSDVPVLPVTLVLLSAGLLGTGMWQQVRRRNV
jgi:hypothetical protein